MPKEGASIKSSKESQSRSSSRPAEQSRSRLFDALIVKSWWVILLLLLIFFAYDQAMHKRLQEQQMLVEKLEQLRINLTQAQKEQEELKLQIASQQDPAWIELVLMRGLGLVPEGQTKVYFSNI